MKNWLKKVMTRTDLQNNSQATDDAALNMSGGLFEGQSILFQGKTKNVNKKRKPKFRDFRSQF